MLRIILIILTFASVSACSVFPIHPELAADPESKTVFVIKKPSDMHLRIDLGFRTTSDDCRLNNFIAGVRVANTERVVKSIPAGVTDAVIEFYMDKYVPGKCGWVPAGFLYSVDSNPSHQLAGLWQPLAVFNRRDGLTDVSLDFICQMRGLRGNDVRVCHFKDKDKLFGTSAKGFSAEGGKVRLRFFDEEPPPQD